MARGHSIIDDDNRFIIDTETGAITNVSGNKPTLMQRNRNSEQFTFELPRTIEGHDVFDLDLVEIRFQNTGKGTSASLRLTSADSYKVDYVDEDPKNPERAIITWLLGKNATVHAGTLSFQIWFECYADDFVWQTDIYSDVIIKPSLSVNEVISNNYPDALTELNRRVSELEEKSSPMPALTFTDDGDGNVTIMLTEPDETSV